MTVRVRLLGRPFVEPRPGQLVHPPRGRKSWALLARIALADRPLTRGELAAELFPETDDPAGSLRWGLADLRRSLGLSQLLRGDRLRLARTDLWFDVWALEDQTLPYGEIGGALLDGIVLRDCPEFDLWLLMARSHYGLRSDSELRNQALEHLANGRLTDAVGAAQRAARLQPLDDPVQELFVRALVAAGRIDAAMAQVAACEALFAREGMRVSPALRAAAQDRRTQPRGVRAGSIATALLQAGTAALDAGAADAGIETLRRAAEEADRAGDTALLARALLALGSALVHAVRGFDGEGAVVLHQGLRAARLARRPDVTAEILRELGYVDVQAGRHVSAARELENALREANDAGDAALAAAITAVQAMNLGDRGRHVAAAALLERSAKQSEAAGRPRNQVWSLGTLARSQQHAGWLREAQATAEASLAGARRHQWTAYQPWPQAIRAECLVQAGQWREARRDAEEAFALACELGDPCWEGMAARALGEVAALTGKYDAAWEWMADARQRCDRVPDRYVWVSGHISLAQLNLAAKVDRKQVPELAARLYQDAVRFDLPEFAAWALVHQARSGDRSPVAHAQAAARGVDNPALHEAIAALAAG
jgi:DNA-binding SARP family transcriptional activator